MSDQIEMPEEFTAPRGAGPQLRLAREKLGLTVEQMAERTRIPLRQIAAIEAGDFAALPGRSYAVGFARTMARECGLDEEAIVEKVRAELDSFGPSQRQYRETYEPGDPARAPTRRLVWFSIGAVVLLLIGLYAMSRVLFAPAAELPSLVAAEADSAQVAGGPAQGDAVPAVDPAGAVTFTAQGAVWVRFSDADGRRLMEGEMAQGDTFTVPTDAEGPRIITGRPDLLAITVGERAVPRLSTEPVTVSNVPVDAASLLARPAPAATPAATPTPPTSAAPAR
jgi:cytoskeleton protein RodZ